MQRVSMRRIALAVIASYATNGLLVALTEQFLPRVTSIRGYFTADLITQCIYEVIAGSICSLVAGTRNRRLAMIILVLLGLLAGSVSLVFSWKAEPRWYGIALLSVWAPCVWIGYILHARPWSGKQQDAPSPLGQ